MLEAPIAVGRLSLRRWREQDAPALSRAVEENLEHLRPWMPWAIHEPQSLEERVALMRQWDLEWDSGENRNVGMWVEGSVVGACGLHRRIGPGGLEIGYWVHRGHVRRGYATTAARMLTTLAFELPDVERVEIRPDRANAASSEIPRRLGFGLAGETEHPPVAPGETGVRLVWRMQRDRWVAT